MNWIGILAASILLGFGINSWTTNNDNRNAILDGTLCDEIISNEGRAECQSQLPMAQFGLWTIIPFGLGVLAFFVVTDIIQRQRQALTDKPRGTEK